MKKLLRIVIVLLAIIPNYIIGQTVTLHSNGYNTSLTQVSNTYYTEWSGTKPFSRSDGSNTNSSIYNSLIQIKDNFGIITNTNTEAQFAINELNSFQSTINTPFYYNSDGTLQAPTSTIFFKPINLSTLNTDFSQYGTIKAHDVFSGYYYLNLSNSSYNTGDEVINLCNTLFDNGVVSIAEPVFIRLIKSSTDPFQNQQWYEQNNGQSGGTVGADLKATLAWNLGYSGCGITVAVIDEGVDLNHADLSANLLSGYDATGNNSAGGCNAGDSHGTKCAGIIAAVHNNIGIEGIAYNSKIIPIRIAFKNTSGDWVTNDSWLSSGIDQAVSMGADILSNSWSGGSPSIQIDLAIQNAVTNGRNGKGSIVLFAAGNYNTALAYPASNPNVIAVGKLSM